MIESWLSLACRVGARPGCALHNAVEEFNLRSLLLESTELERGDLAIGKKRFRIIQSSFPAPRRSGASLYVDQEDPARAKGE